MFARLWHHAFIRRHDKHHQINTMYACQHVLDEAFITGNIHESNVDIAKIEVSKPEVNGYPAFLFFRKTIGITAGQRAHERAFSVIDMTGSADDDGRHV